MTGLTQGTHTLVIRVKDENYRWSIVYAGEIEKKGDNLWTGTVSIEWDNSGNWSDGVPTNTSFVVIPDVSGQSGNFPTVNTAAKAYNVTVESDAEMTIGSGQSLTVEKKLKMQTNSTLTNKGTLTVKGTDLNK